MKLNFFLIISIILFCFLIPSCKPSNCDDEMEKIRKELGAPEEVETYDSSDYHSQTWWYWSKGISYTFKWGTLIEQGCEVSKYTFTPIPGKSSEEIRAKIKEELKLESRIIIFK